jgi:hypothetical protein
MQNAILGRVLGAALTLASAASSAATLGYQTVPFELTGVLLEVAGPSARCPSQFGGTITGYGDSPLAGRLSFVATDCITPAPPIFNFSRGRFIIMTTSGDQIFASYSGQMIPTGEGTQYTFTGASFQITGGTGAYLFASGGGTLLGNEDMATGQGTLKLTGRMSYWVVR